MKYLELKIKPEGKIYGVWLYVGETETHYLAIEIDREGEIHTVVHALSKIKWKIKGVI